MNILTVAVCVSVLSFMATMTHGAPLGVTALVGQEQFQDLVRRSQSLIQKILPSISEVHRSAVYIQLDSQKNSSLAIMASKIGIPQAPILRVVSENCTLETSLRQMSQGLQLHQDLLNAVLPELENVKMTDLSNDIRDLKLQIHKMLRLVLSSSPSPSPSSPPTVKPVVLRLSGEFEVQVAAHCSLQQLEAFSQDVVRCLRSMERSEDEPDS
ncbi:unnamed protein product [Knipowitschia caucasica]